MDILTDAKIVAKAITHPYLFAGRNVAAAIRHEERRHPRPKKGTPRRVDWTRITARDLAECEAFAEGC